MDGNVSTLAFRILVLSKKIVNEIFFTVGFAPNSQRATQQTVWSKAAKTMMPANYGNLSILSAEYTTH
jgi:hypothetical protein